MKQNDECPRAMVPSFYIPIAFCLISPNSIATMTDIIPIRWKSARKEYLGVSF